jgi:amino acid permease
MKINTKKEIKIVTVIKKRIYSMSSKQFVIIYFILLYFFIYLMLLAYTIYKLNTKVNKINEILDQKIHFIKERLSIPENKNKNKKQRVKKDKKKSEVNKSL